MPLKNTSLQLSITSDYVISNGCPQPYLKRIAEAGFTHVHWCHNWDNDFLYSNVEVTQIERWFAEYDLKLLNLHASAGREKIWESEIEYERQAGVELVRNRLEMASRLGADVIILHANRINNVEFQLRSLWELESVARFLGVRIALENLPHNPISALDKIFAEFSPEYIGLCYDIGHGNMNQDALNELGRYGDRLIALHLHDNDGKDDLHKIPMTGNIDWLRFVKILAASIYDKPLNLEVVNRNHPGMTEEEFLKASYESGAKLTKMLAEYR